MRDDFCAFILTHGRPDKVLTYRTLRRAGYTGKIFIVVDDEDKTRNQYMAEFGEQVLVFSKADIASRFDEADNFCDRRSIFYARNACFDLAKLVGCKYFIQLDDDYHEFQFRVDRNYDQAYFPIRKLDAILSEMLAYYESIPALSIAMSQGGDFLGDNGGHASWVKRKAMNSFICSVDRPFSFMGRINEDVNTYTNLGRCGELFMTIGAVQLGQKQTQKNSGGMTELYLDSGTVNERLRDESIAHAVWISRYSTGVAARMVKILNDSDAELTARLLIALDSLDPGNFTVKRLESLLASVRKVNRTAINSMFTSLSGELNELAIYEAGYQLSLFDSMLPDFVADVHPLVGISPDALYAAAMARPFQGRLLSEWASDLEADRLRRITNTVRQGFLLGDTNEQIARKIRGHVSKGFQDGALQMSRANAASIAKTAVGHLAATARESFASANNDLIKGKQWLSTLDKGSFRSGTAQPG